MLAALCGSFLFPASVGADHSWEILLYSRQLTDIEWGCSNIHNDVTKHCSNAGHHNKILGQHPIISGTTYTIIVVSLTSSSLTIAFDRTPPAATNGWLLNVDGYLKTLRRDGASLTTDAAGLDWRNNKTVKIRLEDPQHPHHDPDSDFLSAGSRSEAHCRDATKDDETKGYWHCHGDGDGVVVHQHAEPHWSQPHRPPTHTADKCTVETHTTTTTTVGTTTTTVGTTATTLPSVWHCHTDGTYHAHALARSGHNHATAATDGGPPIAAPGSKPATQAERDAGFGSGWHSHNEPGYNVHHRHGTGEHPH